MAPIDREGLGKQYNPYTNEQWEKIKYWWDLYRGSIELEGELYIRLKKSGMNEEKVLEEIERCRKKATIDRESWNDMRQETIKK